MDAALIDLINTAADGMETEIRRIGAREYLARWDKKTGRLFNSIDAIVSTKIEVDGQLSIRARCVAGLEGALFYVWFLELGTGKHIQDKTRSRRPYGSHDEVGFNPKRLDYPAYNGWLILARSGPFEGLPHFNMYGMPGKNWFENWTREAREYFKSALAQLRMEIQLGFGV